MLRTGQHSFNTLINLGITVIQTVACETVDIVVGAAPAARYPYAALHRNVVSRRIPLVDDRAVRPLRQVLWTDAPIIYQIIHNAVRPCQTVSRSVDHLFQDTGGCQPHIIAVGRKAHVQKILAHCAVLKMVVFSDTGIPDILIFQDKQPVMSQIAELTALFQEDKGYL